MYFPHYLAHRLACRLGGWPFLSEGAVARFWKSKSEHSSYQECGTAYPKGGTQSVLVSEGANRPRRRSAERTLSSSSTIRTEMLDMGVSSRRASRKPGGAPGVPTGMGLFTGLAPG